MTNDEKSKKSLSKEYIKSYRRELPEESLSDSESDELFNNILKETNPIVKEMKYERKQKSKSILQSFVDRMKGLFIATGSPRILRPAVVIVSVLIISLGMYYLVFDREVTETSDPEKKEIATTTPLQKDKVSKDEISKKTIETSPDKTTKTKRISLGFLPLTLAARDFTEDVAETSESDSALFIRAFQLLEETLNKNNLQIAFNNNGIISTGWKYYEDDDKNFRKSRLLISQVKSKDTGISVIEEKMAVTKNDIDTESIIKKGLYKKIIIDFKTKYYSTFD